MYAAREDEINQTTNVVEMWRYRGYILDNDDEIVIPNIDLRKPATFYMLPMEDIDEKYKLKSVAFQVPIDKIATTPCQYYRIASNWFSGNLKKFEPVFYAQVKSKTYPNDLKLALQRYITYIFESPDAAFNHQLAYAAYVLDTVCSSCEWSNR